MQYYIIIGYRITVPHDDSKHYITKKENLTTC